MTKERLIDLAIKIIDERGKAALDEAAQTIFQYEYGNGMVSDALKYYAKTILPRVLPIFPALIYLSCKIVGGKPEKTRCLAVAMMLITASGDIHDDIIDESTYKARTKTLLGKFGRDITLLAGDALLLQGTVLLQNNCEFLNADQRKKITELVTKSMFELTEAEAIETSLWKKTNVTPQEYFEVIKHKGSIAELHCRIGGIIGSADEKALIDLKNYGRAIGILSTTKDEFMDMLRFSEFRHRIHNEMPPYPMIYALQNEEIRKQIEPVIKKKVFSKKDLLFVAEIVLNSPEVKKLKAELRELGENALANNSLLQDSEKDKEAAVLLQALATEM